MSNYGKILEIQKNPRMELERFRTHVILWVWNAKVGSGMKSSHKISIRELKKLL